MKGLKWERLKNPVLTIFLTVVIMAAGFLGIWSLGKLLPKASGTASYDHLQLSEEETQNPDSIPNIQKDTVFPPFTDAYLPQGTLLYKEKLTVEALELIADLLNHTAMNQTDWDPKHELEDLEHGQAGIWEDADGAAWLLWTASTDRKQVHIAIHPEYGICCLQMIGSVPEGVSLDVSEAMLMQAMEACDAYVQSWWEIAETEGYDASTGVSSEFEDGSQFFGLSDGHTFRSRMALPQKDQTPQLIQEESGCRLIYEAPGGWVWISYDYLAECVSGYAFVPNS